jgi:hypothetical protein
MLSHVKATAYASWYEASSQLSILDVDVLDEHVLVMSMF